MIILQCCKTCVFSTDDSLMRCPVNPLNYSGGYEEVQCGDYEPRPEPEQWDILRGTEWVRQYPYSIYNNVLEVIKTEGLWVRAVSLPYAYSAKRAELRVLFSNESAGWATALPLLDESGLF